MWSADESGMALLSIGEYLPQASNIFGDLTMFDMVECTKLGKSV